MDNDLEVAPIYRHGGMGEEPRRPHKPESHCKQPALSERAPIPGSLVPNAKILEMQYHKWLLEDLGSDWCMTAMF